MHRASDSGRSQAATAAVMGAVLTPTPAGFAEHAGHAATP
jgi:hypothetical protein